MYATYFADKRQESCSCSGSINNRDLAGQRNKSVQKNTSSRDGSIGTKPIIHWLKPDSEQLIRPTYQRDRKSWYVLASLDNQWHATVCLKKAASTLQVHDRILQIFVPSHNVFLCSALNNTEAVPKSNKLDFDHY